MSGLAARLGLGDRELVAVVGAGGKTTLVFGLGAELAADGSKVVMTTTTKLGADQARRAPVLCRRTEPGVVAAALQTGGPVMLIDQIDGHKATGPGPEVVDALYASGVVDYLLVEADGARRKSFKAPAAHEPVIPSTATVVVTVVGVDALDRPIAVACHRPERVAALAGCTPHEILDVEACARVVTHPEGGLKGISDDARAIVALSRVIDDRTADLARRLAEAVAPHSRIDRVVVLGGAAPA